MNSLLPSVKRRQSNAFTLLEVLITIAMVSVLMGALSAVLFGTLRLRETTDDVFEAELPRHMIITIIKRDLTNMVAPPGLPPVDEEAEAEEEEPPEPEEEETDEEAPEVSGPLAGPLIGELDEDSGQRADSISFCTATGLLNEYDPWPHIQRVDYYLEPSGSVGGSDSYELMRTVNRDTITDEEELTEELEGQSLLSNVESMEIAYFDGEEWLDEWNSEEQNNAMPLAISLRIDFLPPDEEQENQRLMPPIELFIPVTIQVIPAPPEEPEEGEESGGGGGGGDR